MNFFKICGKIIKQKMCPDGLMDKTADSGSADTGSIPVRDTKNPYTKVYGFLIFIDLIKKITNFLQ